MKLSDQVISLADAKRLKELGISQHSLFVYVNFPETEFRPELTCIIYSPSPDDYKDPGEIFSAFTVSEHGEMFPTDLLHDSGHHYTWYHRFCWKGHSLGYSQVGGHDHIEIVWFTTEIAARAALLIHLIEHAWISVEEINKRINS